MPPDGQLSVLDTAKAPSILIRIDKSLFQNQEDKCGLERVC
jgi:hypothetical protein